MEPTLEEFAKYADEVRMGFMRDELEQRSQYKHKPQRRRNRTVIKLNPAERSDQHG